MFDYQKLQFSSIQQLLPSVSTVEGAGRKCLLHPGLHVTLCDMHVLGVVKCSCMMETEHQLGESNSFGEEV